MWLNFIISLIFLFCAISAQGQKSYLDSLQSIPSNNWFYPTSVAKQKENQKPSCKLPLFCEFEKRWDKKSKTKLRFRIGDQQTVDRLEGK